MTVTPDPGRPLLVRPVDRRLAGAGSVRRRHPPAPGPGRGRAEAGRVGRLGHHLPRRRRRPVRLRRRDPRPDPRRLPRGLRRDRHHHRDGDHEHFHPPGLQGRRVHLERPRRCAASGCARCCATSTWPPSWAPRRSSCGAAARAPSTTAPRTSTPRSTVTARASTRWPATSRTRATTCGSPSSPSRTSRAATSCCRPSGTPSASSPSCSTATSSASTRRSGTSRWPGSTTRHGIAQALWADKLFHIDLNGQRSIKYDQDLVLRPRRPALGVLHRRPGRERLPGGGPTYDGPRHFDYKPSRTEGFDGVWVSAAANMATYLAAQGARRGVPRRPRGAGRDEAAGVAELAEPTLAEARRSPTCWPIASPSRTSTPTRRASAVRVRRAQPARGGARPRRPLSRRSDPAPHLPAGEVGRRPGVTVACGRGLSSG